MTVLIMADYVGELNIPIILSNCCMLSIMPKHLYARHENLHKCQRIPEDNMIIHVGNGDINVYFCIVIPLYMQQVQVGPT